MLMCAGLTACERPPVNETPATYAITADFNPEEGAVELSHASAAEGTQITVTVTANEGYEIDWVSAEPDTFSSIHYVELDENGVGVFTMWDSDTVVHARFKATGVNVPPEGEGEFTVTVSLSEFAAAHGEVSVSAPAEGKKYKHGESVTVTLTPHEGYEVGTVTLNGETFTGDSFEIEEDTTISATFYPVSANLPVVSGLPSNGFGILFRSRWTNVESGMPLFVGTNKMSLGEDAITAVAPSGTGSEQSYRFTANGHDYELGWLNFGYSVGYVLHLLDYTTEKSAYFVKDPLPAAQIEERYDGEWVDEITDVTLKINGDEIVFHGAKAELVVDLGYFESSADEYRGPINAHMYYFFVNGTPYLLGWYPDGACPTVNTRTYVEDVERVYTFAAMFHGKWTSLDGATTMEISESELLVNGEAGTYRGYNEYMFRLTLDGVEYEVTTLLESSYVLQLMHFTFGSDGLMNGVSTRYFILDSLPEVSVNTALYGAWSCPYADDLAISAEGITWGSDRAIVISEGAPREDGFSYTLVLRDSVYTLSFLDLWAGYKDESDIPEDVPHWLFILEGTNGYYEFNAK